MTPTDNEEQDVLGPTRRPTSQIGPTTGKKDLISELQSAQPADKEAIIQHIEAVFQPIDDAGSNSAKADIEMTDDDGYSVLSKCKIGSAVMLPYILDPQWKA